MSTASSREAVDPRVGLCSRCHFAAQVPSSRGAQFWRCLRAADDRRFSKYPSLPVLLCHGFEALGPAATLAKPEDK